MQVQIGPDVGNIHSLNNEQCKMITRLHFGKDIISRNVKNEELKCIKCGMINDYKGNHAFNCISGKYNHTWWHDQINKEICKLLDEYTTNYKLEPRKLDNNNEQRPDIIVHDQMKMKDGKYYKCYYDTMITNIYNDKNIKDIQEIKSLFLMQV